MRRQRESHRRRSWAARLLGLLALTAATGSAAWSPSAANAQAVGADEPLAVEPYAGPQRQMFEPEWRERFVGRTVYYEMSRGYPTGAGLMGKEYYVPNSNKVVFVYNNGECFEGTYDVSDGVFCFNYDDRHCFRHYERDGQWIVVELDGREQIVASVTDEVLSCTPDLTG